jgi:methionyl-tRNA synthetase
LRRLAVCQRGYSPGQRHRLLSTGGYLCPLPSAARKPCTDGLRLRHTRHAGDGESGGRGTEPQEIIDYYHGRFLQLFTQLGLTYDLFTHTGTENHHQVAQDIFTSLLKNEYMYTKVTKQMYSPSAGKFLPDRYIEGNCPKCGFARARGDQCDNCNTLFESAAELINPRSKLDNSALELRDTEHFFIDLPAIAEDGLNAWIQKDKEHWRPQVINFARNFVLEQG